MTGRVVLAAVLAAAVASGGVAGAVRAADAPDLGWAQGREPLEIDADSLEARGDDGLVVFRGNVVARQGDLTLQADRVVVTVDAETREIREVKADGEVRIRRGDVVATGREAAYDAVRGVVVLSGDPKVWRGRDLVAGDRITLYLAENRSEVTGARAILHPGPPPGRAGP